MVASSTTTNGDSLEHDRTSLESIPAGTYNVDPAHSNVGFEVRHMGIATVRGAFRKFQGTIDATGSAPVLEGTVEVASIDTQRSPARCPPRLT